MALGHVVSLGYNEILYLTARHARRPTGANIRIIDFASERWIVQNYRGLGAN